MARQAARRLAGINLRLAGRCYATERYGPDSQYSILGVAPSASTADIKAAFRKVSCARQLSWVAVAYLSDP